MIRKMFGYRLAAFIIVLLLITSLHACQIIPPEIQQEMDHFWDQQMQQLRNQAKDWINEQIQIAKQKAADLPRTAWEWTKEQGQGIIDKINETLGRKIPAEVGRVSAFINPQTKTSHQMVQEAFQAAYKRAGSGLVIGWPKDQVNYWSQSEQTLLVQYFEGGREEQSAIVMEDGKTEAYVIPGVWLSMYTELGGPTLAGYPLSDPKTWNITPAWKIWESWGKGQRQVYALGGENYGLTRRNGSKVVHLVPSFLWREYEKSTVNMELGYPLSGYPLDDRAWDTDQRISAESRRLLEKWSEKPIRAIIFEHGGILFNEHHNSLQVIKEKKLYGIGKLSDANFMLEIYAIFHNEWENRFVSGQSDACFTSTLEHAKYMAGSDYFQTAMGEVAKMPIESAMAVVKAETLMAKIIKFATETLLEMATGSEAGEAIIRTTAGTMLDPLYEKAFGDMLSAPASKVTLTMVEGEYDNLRKQRLTRGLKIIPGSSAPIVGFTPTMDVTLIVTYDPQLNLVSGVMSSKQCLEEENKPGYAFYFIFDTGSVSTGGKIAPAGTVWDGKIHFIDLGTGEDIP